MPFAGERSRDGLPGKRKPVPSGQLATLAAFFDRYKVDELRSGNADTQGDPVLERATQSVAAKAPIARSSWSG